MLEMLGNSVRRRIQKTGFPLLLMFAFTDLDQGGGEMAGRMLAILPGEMLADERRL